MPIRSLSNKVKNNMDESANLGTDSEIQSSKKLNSSFKLEPLNYRQAKHVRTFSNYDIPPQK